MKRTRHFLSPIPAGIALFFLLLSLAATSRAQDKQAIAVNRDSLIAAAREIIAMQTYCALVTLDSTGQPAIRTMNPFPPEEDMSVWMATSSRSRKVEQIRKDPCVCLYYADHKQAVGSVIITGKAVLVDDMSEKLKRKRAYWDQAFPDWKYLMLIKVVPEEIEVLNYRRGFVNEPLTFKAPSIELDSKSTVKTILSRPEP